jgi:hypothetical protein
MYISIFAMYMMTIGLNVKYNPMGYIRVIQKKN